MENGVYDLAEIIKMVKTKKVSVRMTFEPDRTEMTIEPWESYTPTCPYAKEE